MASYSSSIKKRGIEALFSIDMCTTPKYIMNEIRLISRMIKNIAHKGLKKFFEKGNISSVQSGHVKNSARAFILSLLILAYPM